MELTWEEAQSAALNRQEWRLSVPDPMRPPGCGMIQGQSQVQGQVAVYSMDGDQVQ